MKTLKLIIPFILLSDCSERPNTTANEKHSIPKDTLIKHDTHPASSEAKRVESKNQFSWTGLINNKIPVFLHYSVVGELIVGEIYYLNTKSRKPIQVIGSIEEDKSYRLLEFESNGNISGIIKGTPEGSRFDGSWFSPKARRAFSLNLKTKDSTVNPVDLRPADNDIFGDYHYQYSEAGYHGDMEVKKVSGDKLAFSIYSVTNDPARNLAEVPMDTVKMSGNSFIYNIPESDSCEFKVKFYRGFAVVDYTRGYCEGQFGMNATVDGIFLKINK